MDELPAVQLAVKSLLLSGCHLVEVMMVYAPLVGGKPLTNLLEMISELVHREITITASGQTLRITADEFQDSLSERIYCLVGKNNAKSIEWPSSLPPSARNTYIALALC